MNQFVEQVGNDLAGLELQKMPANEVQFIFEALADFFTKNAKLLQGDHDDQKVQITVNIQVNPG